MSSDENDPIKAEAARYKRATDAAAKSRGILTKLVIDALREPGAKPADIARRAEWTAAYVRKVARENGIEADPAYQARTQKARARVLAEAEAAQVPQSSNRPSWLASFPVIAVLSRDEAARQAGRLATVRPEWFEATRRAYEGEAAWVDYAMLAADADDPATEALQAAAE